MILRSLLLARLRSTAKSLWKEMSKLFADFYIRTPLEIMAKLDVKVFAADVGIIDPVVLKRDTIISSISTIIYILLKTYKEERTMTELPAPTTLNGNIRGPWHC